MIKIKNVKDFIINNAKKYSKNKTIQRIAIMCVCAAVISTAALTWAPRTMALEVIYNNKTVGYVTNKTEVTNAINIIEDTLADNTTFSVQEPKFEVSFVKNTNITKTETLSENIAEADGTLVKATGLYIDGDLKAVSESYNEIEKAVDDVVSNADVPNENAEVSIDNDVKIDTQYYNIDTAEAYSLNQYDGIGNMVTLVVSVVVSRTEEIPYETEYIEDENMYAGYSMILTDGENGSKEIVEKVNYINGEEVSRELVETNTIKEPVSKVVKTGTDSHVYIEETTASDYNYSSSSSNKNSTIDGYLYWPVASEDFKLISAYWGDGRNHKGIDFAGNYGGKILSAFSGTVTFAGWSDSAYGYMIIVDHGAGIQTAYAHCSGISVSVGQEVSAGELIGYIGTSGRATGPHLHFEVRVDGVKVNPAPYFGL